jgi:hypothetical protein
MFFLNHYFLLSFILHDVLSNFAFSNQSSHHTRSEKGIEDWPISSYLSSISWGEFIDSHVNTKNSNDYDLIAPKLDRLHLCPQSIVTNLTSKLSIIHKKWCNWAFDPKGGNVKVGESYGNLKSADIQRFEYLNCNTLLTGIDLTCDDVRFSSTSNKFYYQIVIKNFKTYNRYGEQDFYKRGNEIK